MYYLTSKTSDYVFKATYIPLRLDLCVVFPRYFSSSVNHL